MSSLSRRRFLKTSMAATGALAIGQNQASAAKSKDKKKKEQGNKPQSKRPTSLLGANERVLIAIAGINGRGNDAHIPEFCSLEGVEVAYLVDPDSRLFDSRVKKVTDSGQKAPMTVQDIRRALDDKNVNAVSVATPNHWHSLITIWACQAGKDVYVEKPCSHNIHEGRIAVETARKYKRIVQHGTQSRSSGGWDNAIAAAQSGKYGKMLVSRGVVYKPGGDKSTRVNIGFAPITDPPKELNFDVWLGPAPKQGYHENLVHYRWHWFWDTGNGDIGNQGVHQMDIARWGIKDGLLPRSVISIGGRFGPKDQGQVANEQLAFFDYGNTQLIFEVRGFKSPKYLGEECNNVWHTEEGTINGTRGFIPKGSDKAEPLAAFVPARDPKDANHFRNFIEAVVTRKHEDLHADILVGHYSAALCHLANASYRLGAEVPFDAKTKAFGDNKEAYETFGRMEAHLKENGFQMNDLKYRLGRQLIIDPKTELTNDEEANKILTGSYRAPFLVPDAVA